MIEPRKLSRRRNTLASLRPMGTALTILVWTLGEVSEEGEEGEGGEEEGQDLIQWEEEGAMVVDEVRVLLNLII